MKKLIEFVLGWLMDPENIKKIITWVVEFVDKKAKENPEENFWDQLDDIFDFIKELIETKKLEAKDTPPREG